ncbi:MAG: sulfatase-like hydrolase/transferase, partial [Gammaproteobacteria bacterium]|nr:sulfatase-like hydrolase/transferase [Gammaproteobacteria bacterium]
MRDRMDCLVSTDPVAGRFHAPLICLIVLFAGLLGSAFAQAQSTTPNVVLILADDLGYGDVGTYGAADVFTPNIDRLASEGVKFDRFYMTPSCSISRALLLTGSYAPRVSMSRNNTPSAATGIHENEITLGEMMQGAGYATGVFGKWHLGDHYQYRPQRHGFDEFYGIPYSNNMWPFHPRTRQSANEDPRLTAARQRAELTGYAGQGSPFPAGEGYPNLPLYDDDSIIEFNSDQDSFGLAFFDQAVNFIERNQAGPFFAFVSLTAPHVPLHPSAAFVGTSARGLYGDTIHEIDEGVGRILSKLTELGIDNNTLVIFVSDNGPWLEYGIDGGSAGPLGGGKEGQFEGGIRVPALMRWPGELSGGTVISEPVTGADLWPTLAGRIGATVPTDRVIDGIDIWALMIGAVTTLSRPAIFSFAEQDFTDIELGAIISGDWKLHVNTNGNDVTAVALYDLAGDPGETTDIKGSQTSLVASLVGMGEAIIADIAATQRPLGSVTRSGEPFAETSGVGDIIAFEAEQFHVRESRGGHSWQSVSLRHSSF